MIDHYFHVSQVCKNTKYPTANDYSLIELGYTIGL
jgi:hypothetical protein